MTTNRARDRAIRTIMDKLGVRRAAAVRYHDSGLVKVGSEGIHLALDDAGDAREPSSVPKPARLDFDLAANYTGRIYLGQKLDGGPACTPAPAGDWPPTVMLAGPAGSGKTMALSILLWQSALAGDDIYVASPRLGYPYATDDFEFLSGYLCGTAGTVEETATMLAAVCESAANRPEPKKWSVVVIDEIGSFLQRLPDDRDQAECAEEIRRHIGWITRVGRSMRVRLVLSGQQFRAGDFEDRLSSPASKLLMGRTSVLQRVSMFGTASERLQYPVAEDVRGIGLWRSCGESEPSFIQVPFADLRDLRAELLSRRPI